MEKIVLNNLKKNKNKMIIQNKKYKKSLTPIFPSIMFLLVYFPQKKILKIKDLLQEQVYKIYKIFFIDDNVFDLRAIE